MNVALIDAFQVTKLALIVLVYRAAVGGSGASIGRSESCRQFKPVECGDYGAVPTGVDLGTPDRRRASTIRRPTKTASSVSELPEAFPTWQLDPDSGEAPNLLRSHVRSVEAAYLRDGGSNLSSLKSTNRDQATTESPPLFHARVSSIKTTPVWVSTLANSAGTHIARQQPANLRSFAILGVGCDKTRS